MRVKIMIASALLLACGVVLSFGTLLSPSRPDYAGPAGAQRASRGQERSPVLVATQQAGASGEPAAPPIEPAEQAHEAAATPSEPLRPEQEAARLRKLLDDSGGAAGDALDRSSREIAGELVTQLRSHKAGATLQAVDCRAAGCTMTLEIDSQDDYARLHDLFGGVARESPLSRWPGARVVPPAVLRSNGKLLVSVMLIRPDSKVNFG